MFQQNSTRSPAIHRKAHHSAVLMARAVFEVSVASHPMPCCNVPACRHVAIDYATHQRVISHQRPAWVALEVLVSGWRDTNERIRFVVDWPPLWQRVRTC